MSDLRRHARQVLLAEIGEKGQQRLGAAVAAVGGEGLAHEIAAAYASRAGMGSVAPGFIDESERAPSFLEHAAPRAVVAGSRAALSALRAVLLTATEAKPAGHA